MTGRRNKQKKTEVNEERHRNRVRLKYHEH
jgi:hypothetical protein